MFPGMTTRVSEGAVPLTTTISPVTDAVRVTDTTTTTVLATIVPPYAGFSGILFLTNLSGNNITAVTTGNIQTALVMTTGLTHIFVYSQIANKWYQVT